MIPPPRVTATLAKDMTKSLGEFGDSARKATSSFQFIIEDNIFNFYLKQRSEVNRNPYCEQRSQQPGNSVWQSSALV